MEECEFQLHLMHWLVRDDIRTRKVNCPSINKIHGYLMRRIVE